MMYMFEAIFILAGHSEKDPGTTHEGTTEREITKSIAQFVASALGQKVITVGIDESMTVAQKTKKVNDICRSRKFTASNSILCEIHVDYALAPSGFAAYHYAESNESKALAQKILDSLKDTTGRPIRWNKGDTDSPHGRLGIVRDTTPLAVLIEVGSIKADKETLLGAAGKDEAMAVARAIAEYAGMPAPVPITGDIEQAMQLISSAWHDFGASKLLADSGQIKLNQANEILRGQ